MLAGLPSSLHPFQVSYIERAIYYRSHFAVFDTGLGKTWPTLQAIERDHALPALIIVPASAIGTWTDEIKQRWPAMHDILVVDASAAITEEVRIHGPASVTITTYQLLRRNVAFFAAIAWKAIIFDEVHHLRHDTSGISQAAERITANKPRALKLALTATPVANEPSNFWHLAHVLRRGILGSEFAFNQRYSVEEYNEEGYRLPWAGLNPEHAEELRSRAAFFQVRATDQEWGHLKPPLDVIAVRTKPPKKLEFRKLMAKWDGERKLHDVELDAYFQRAGSMKIDPAVEVVLQARQSISHVLVAAYYHETAHELTAALQREGETVFEITGDDPIKRRKEKILKASKTPNCCIVVSMKSVSESINTLTFCHGLVIAELSYVPLDLEQLMGRVRRLNSKAERIRIWVLILRGTLDEAVAASLDTKVSNINTIIKAGESATKLQEALKSRKLSREEMIAELMATAKNRIAPDAYSG